MVAEVSGNSLGLIYILSFIYFIFLCILLHLNSGFCQQRILQLLNCCTNRRDCYGTHLERGALWCKEIQ